ncbi:MAG: hypothetical protein ACI4XL_02915 [Bacillus sp. (in: firmicutes)]
MGYSEIVVMLLVYSGLIVFFLVPFQSGWNQHPRPINFITVFKDSLTKMIFHKKSIFALILISFTLFSIWFGYKGEEYHFNAHSGYPISTNLKAFYSMCGVLVYTVILYTLIAFLRTLKIVKNTRS